MTLQKIQSINLRILIVLIFYLFSRLSFSQNIEPKVGYKDLHIGMTSAELINSIGNPSQILSEEEEISDWLNSNYVIESKIVFHIGFDRVYIFNQNNQFGLWKAYVKNDLIVYLNITSYNLFSENMSKISIDNKLKFGDTIDDVFRLMKDKYYLNIDEHGSTEVIFFSKGLRFIFINEELHHVYVFKPLTKAGSKKIIDRFATKKEH